MYIIAMSIIVFICVLNPLLFRVLYHVLI